MWPVLVRRKEEQQMATISQGMRNRLPQLNKKTIIIGAIVAVLIAVGIAIPALQSQSTANAVGTTMVAAAVDISAEITATGKMTPIQSANLGYAVGGRVAQVYVVSGDTVSVDAPLVQLDQQMLTLEQTAAQAVVAQAKADGAARGGGRPAAGDDAFDDDELADLFGSVGMSRDGAVEASGMSPGDAG
jgi:multidrug efflux pump subunit AcrA (membrane-fusion protein)